MSFIEEWTHEGTCLGEKVQIDEKTFAYFGNKQVTEDLLARLFPDLKFLWMKQVHGKSIVSAQEDRPEADGHFTNKPNTAIGVITADCMPVLYASGETLVALHAGWRGVAQRILSSAHQQFPADQVFVGPHILPEHFEVGKEILDELIQPASLKSLVVKVHPDPNKAFVDLAGLLKQQAPEALFKISHHCTLTDPRYNSYRRENKTNDRNLSFLFKLS